MYAPQENVGNVYWVAQVRKEWAICDLRCRWHFAEIDELWDQRECMQTCKYYLDIQGEQLRLQVGLHIFSQENGLEMLHKGGKLVLEAACRLWR